MLLGGALPSATLLLLAGCLLPAVASPASTAHPPAAVGVGEDTIAHDANTDANQSVATATVFYEADKNGNRLERPDAPVKIKETTNQFSNDSYSSLLSSSRQGIRMSRGKTSATESLKSQIGGGAEDDDEGDARRNNSSTLRRAPPAGGSPRGGTREALGIVHHKVTERRPHSQDFDCGEFPDVRNGIIDRNITGDETAELRCKPGYRTIAGTRTAKIRCLDGEWKIQSGRVLAPACIPERTHQPATVAMCPSDPPYMEHGVTELSNGTYGELRCLAGYRLAGGSKEVVCKTGQWRLKGRPQCVPEDDSKKESRMIGDLGSSHTTPLCPEPPSFANATTTLENDTYGFVECMPGYLSSRGHHAYFKCVAGVWRFLNMAPGEVLECLPYTDPDCDRAALSVLLHGTVTRRRTGVAGRCWSGFRFPSGEILQSYGCEDGEWVLPESERAGCIPHCPQGCLNGGTCFAPNTCHCPENFMGDRCQTTLEPPKPHRKSLREVLGGGGGGGGGGGAGGGREEYVEAATDLVPSTSEGPVGDEGHVIIVIAGTTTESVTEGGTTTTESVTEGGTTTESVTVGGTTSESVTEGGTTMDSVTEGGTTTTDSVTEGGTTTTDSVTEGGTTTDSVTEGGTTTEFVTDSSVQAGEVPPTTDAPQRKALRREISGTRNDLAAPAEVTRSPLEECGTLLPQLATATVAMRAGEAQAWCDEGFTFPSGLKRVSLLCVDGDWIIPLERVGGDPSCFTQGTCDQPCQNGGMCRPDGRCFCPEGFSGQWCEVQQCDDPPSVYNAALVIRGETATAECRDGYAFSRGETQLDFTCVEGAWVVPGYRDGSVGLVCEARCSPPCANGGKCVEPGLCRCPSNYTGDACEVLKCLDPPPFVKNALMKYSPVVTQAECLSGYVFGDGSARLNISCSNGRWRPGLRPDSNRKRLLECRPVCEEGCLNGGKCVAPNTCVCPAPYDGPQCKDVRTNECHEPPPTVKNAHMNYSSMVGVAECIEGYSLCSGETSIKFACSLGQWSFPEGVELPPQCLPVCVGGCQNGGVCEAANHCRCQDDHSGALCQEPPSQTCLGNPLPIPNSFIQMSPRGLLLACRAGYALPSGNTQTELWCQEGAWCPPNSSHQSCSRDMRSLACFPQCQPSCLNHGECVAPDKCRCQDPYTGERCEMLLPEYCWKKPPQFEDAFIQYNSSSAAVTCKPGFAPTSVDTPVILQCVKGEWVTPQDLEGVTLCSPSCTPPCANGGTCVSPNTCVCTGGFYGPQCQETRCPTGPVAVPFSHMQINPDGSEARVVCFKDYIMYSGRRMAQVECVEGRWMTVEKEHRPVESLHCSPYCREPCLNGGSCVAPDECSCPDNYTGSYCQFLRCHGCPDVQGSAEFSISNDTLSAEITCRPFHRLETGDRKMSFTCCDGSWEPLAKVKGQMGCRPECPHGCLNGGTCVAPKTCRCLQGFTGSRCQRRYSLTTKNQPCLFPFLFGGVWYHACTDADSKRPWCATEMDTNGLITGWGVCVANLGEKKVLMSSGGDLCILPFTYQGRTWWGCVSTQDRQRPWCAVRVDSAGVLTSWDYCDLEWGVRPVALTVKGDECHLPVQRNGKLYQECIGDSDPSRPWCPTSLSSKGVPLATSFCIVDWGYKRVVVTKKRQVCVFPFVWKEQLHHSCVEREGNNNMNNHRHRRRPHAVWCATVTEPDGEVLEWGECVRRGNSSDEILNILQNSPGSPSPSLTLNTKITTVTGVQCSLPFVHGGRPHSGCITADSDSDDYRPWCATAVDQFGQVTSRDFCPNHWDLEIPMDLAPQRPLDQDFPGPEVQQERQQLVRTVTGRTCVLPFTHRGYQYHGCIMEDSDRPFCATEVDQSGAPLATDFCPDDWDCTEPDALPQQGTTTLTESGSRCVFPFRYRGMEYNACTSDDSPRAWCATAVDRALYRTVWDFCVQSPEDVRQPADGGHWSSVYEMGTEVVEGGGEGEALPWHPDSTMYSRQMNPSHETWDLKPPVDTFLPPPEELPEAFQPAAESVFEAPLEPVPEYIPETMPEAMPEPVPAEVPGFEPAYDIEGQWFSEPRSLEQVFVPDYEPMTPLEAGGVETITTADGRSCVFPFIWRGKRHTACTSVESEYEWCATRVDIHGRPTATDFCQPLPGADYGRPDPTIASLNSMEGHPALVGHLGIEGHPGIWGHPAIEGHPTVLGHLGVPGHGRIGGHPGLRGHDEVPGHPSIRGHPSSLGHPGVEGHPAIEAHGAVPGHPTVPGHHGLRAHGGIAGHPGVPGHGAVRGHPGVPGHPEAEGHPQIYGHGAVQGHPAAEGHSTVLGHQALEGHGGVKGHQGIPQHPGVPGHPAVPGHRSLRGHQGVRGHSSIQGHPAVKGHQTVPGHPGVEGHEVVEGHPSIPGHAAVIGHEAVHGHEGLPGHPAIRGHPSIPGHPGVQGHPTVGGHGGVHGHAAVHGHPSIPAHPAVHGHGDIRGHQQIRAHPGVERHAAVAGHPLVPGHPGIQGHPTVLGHPAIEGHPYIAGHPGAEGHGSLVGHPGYPGHPTVQGHPAVEGHQDILGHPGIPGHPGVHGHPGIPGHMGALGHSSLVGHPDVAGHPSVGAHPGVQGHPDIEGHPALLGHEIIAGHEGVVGHPAVIGHPGIVVPLELYKASPLCLRNPANTLYTGSCRDILTLERNEPCILPFQHGGRWYYECAALTPGSPPVCPTHLDAAGAPLAWGVCPPGWYLDYLQPFKAFGLTENDFPLSIQEPLPEPLSRNSQLLVSVTRVLTTKGRRCQFPFTYKGEKYSGCTDADHHRPWCVTHQARDNYEWDDCTAVYICKKCLADAYARQYNGHVSSAYAGR